MQGKISDSSSTSGFEEVKKEHCSSPPHCTVNSSALVCMLMKSHLMFLSSATHSRSRHSQELQKCQCHTNSQYHHTSKLGFDIPHAKLVTVVCTKASVKQPVSFNGTSARILILKNSARASAIVSEVSCLATDVYARMNMQTSLLNGLN